MGLLRALVDWLVAVVSSPRRSLFLNTVPDDCQFGVLLQHSQPGSQRAVPIVGKGGSALVWQDGDSIFLQRYETGCRSKNNALLFHSEDFWQQPSDSGLEDALALDENLDSILVSWTLNSNVWILNVSAEKISKPILVNRYNSSQQMGIRLQRGPDGGFVAAWTSWEQDGDGWGIYMQAFSRAVERVGDVVQVNSIWEHFQWRPAITMCGQATYAAWINSTADCVDAEGCNTGPYSRRIMPMDPKPEVSLKGADPEKITLACDKNDAWAFWLDDDNIAYNKLSGNELQVAASLPLQGTKVLNSTLRGRRLQGGGSSAGAQLLYAGTWQLLLVGDDSDGNLAAQLIDLEAHQVHPQRKIADSAALVQAIWDDSNQKFVTCWTEVASGWKTPEVLCSMHAISWLTDVSYWGAGGVLAVIAVACVLCILLCWKQRLATRNNVGRRARARSLLRGIARPGQRAARQDSGPTPQQLQIESQLARIPQVAPDLPPPASAEEGAEGERDSAAPSSPPPPPTPGPPCSICQEDMLSVRVAFNPCGHWACRQCAERLLQTRQKCHLCRANVESVLPVYY